MSNVMINENYSSYISVAMITMIKSNLKRSLLNLRSINMKGSQSRDVGRNLEAATEAEVTEKHY